MATSERRVNYSTWKDFLDGAVVDNVARGIRAFTQSPAGQHSRLVEKDILGFVDMGIKQIRAFYQDKYDLNMSDVLQAGRRRLGKAEKELKEKATPEAKGAVVDFRTTVDWLEIIVSKENNS